MRSKKKTAFLLWAALLLFVLCGCSNGTGDTPFHANDEIALSASFQQEDGIALCNSTVRFSYGEYSTDHSLDDAGELKIPGLPRTGDLRLTVLDQQEEIQGAATLSFSEGAVIDAATDESGIGHITLRRDADEVALIFTLREDGSLFCSLWLIQPDTPDFDLSQEDHQYGR